jgi:delta1-piperideine-2-carboxylate reductase
MSFVQFDSLVIRLRSILERAGCSRTIAQHIARNCASAERDGSKSHGIFRMPGYVSSLLSGWVDGTAAPVIEDVAPAFLRIDAANGYAVPALASGSPLAIEKARAMGIAIVAIRNSHHLGALALDVEPFSDQGLIALSVVNSMKSVVPFGGKRPVFGTNPIAFAAPRASGPPFVFDQATSAMAFGDVHLAMLSGRQLPIGVGVDFNGNSTTDPAAVMDGGALCAFGEHKGASLAIMVELLCAALVGGRFSFECNLLDTPGSVTPRTGQTVILIDPCKGNPLSENFAEPVDYLLAQVVEAGQDRLPGERRLKMRQQAAIDGIALSADELSMLCGLEA